MKLAIAQMVLGARMRKGLWLAASLLMVMALLVGGCAQPAPSPQPAPVTGVLPAEHPTDFPENLKWLTEDEKVRLIEIALNTPKAQECLEQESEYTTRLSWAALFPSSTGEGYSGYQIFEYEIVEKGIPRGTVDVTPEGSPEKIVSVGVQEDAEIYPCVHIHFVEPSEMIVKAAIALEANKAVYVDYYPQRRGPVLPTKTPPSGPPEEAN